jgi:hypothetical protein
MLILHNLILEMLYKRILYTLVSFKHTHQKTKFTKIFVMHCIYFSKPRKNLSMPVFNIYISKPQKNLVTTNGVATLGSSSHVPIHTFKNWFFL